MGFFTLGESPPGDYGRDSGFFTLGESQMGG